MQHTLAVRGRETGAQLPRDLDGLVFRQTADAAQERGEVFAVDKLHREKRPPRSCTSRCAWVVHLTDVEDAADVWMCDAQREAHFVEEAVEPRRVVLEGLGKKLQRHRLPELQIISPIDLTHAATPEQANHAVPARQDGSWKEPRGIAPMARRLWCHGDRRDRTGVRRPGGREQRGSTTPAEALR